MCPHVFVFLFFSFFLLVFLDRVSLCSSGCPGTHFVDQTGLELRNPPASPFGILVAANVRVLESSPLLASVGSGWLSTEIEFSVFVIIHK